jgi:hypothetical protein
MDRLDETQTAQPLLSPICREIRSKKVFTLPSIPMKASDVLDQSNWCWCGMTQQAFGPDGDKVHPDKCAPRRQCYKSHFE